MLPFPYHFSKANLETSLLLPPLVSFFLSFFCGAGGVSGAFLLLPFQVSVLKFTSPSVSATNHLYNCLAIPGGVYRYWKEGRLYFPLVLIISLGTFPGIILGYFLRVTYFIELKNFLLLVGSVLLIIGIKLLSDLFSPKKEIKFSPLPPKTLKFSLTTLMFTYSNQTFRVNTVSIFLLACVIGIIGGIYGIGGGALMAPLLLAFFKIPSYVFAGATLFSTFLTSILGVIIYTLGGNGPDFLLGALFGLGGAVGLNLSAKIQKYIPQKYIKALLGVILLYIALRYIMKFFSTIK